MVFSDFPEPINIITEFQYEERVILHIEMAELSLNNSELILLFKQLQHVIRNRNHPVHITHIQSHTGFPGPLAQGNEEIYQLLVGTIIEASEFHKKYDVNSKGLKRNFSVTWKQAKEIIKNCPTCSLHNQVPFPSRSNPKGNHRNEIWHISVFHFTAFGKLKFVHHTINTYSGLQ